MVDEHTQVELTTRICISEADQLLQPNLDTETSESSSNIYEGIEQALVSQYVFKLSSELDLRCAQLLKDYELKFEHQSYLHTSAVEQLSDDFLNGRYEPRKTESIPGLAQEPLDGLDSWLLHNFVYRVTLADIPNDSDIYMDHQLIYLNPEREILREVFRYNTTSFPMGYKLFQDIIPGNSIPELVEAAIILHKI
jgi:hypothetical protein